MTTPRPGMVRFDGNPEIFYMAICVECAMALPHPNESAREQWINGHRTTGHTIHTAIDVRPDPADVAVRRNALLALLKEKYAQRMPLAHRAACARCGFNITNGQLYVQWVGRAWHADCLDDSAYLNMASVGDILKIPPFNPPPERYRGFGIRINSDNIVANPPPDYHFSDGVVIDDRPKKLNARERRRLRRRDEQ